MALLERTAIHPEFGKVVSLCLAGYLLPVHEDVPAIDAFNSDERRLFDRLSVFAGGWTLEAAQAIDGDALSGICHEQIFDRLTRLIDTSLVIMDEVNGVARYRQLETLRAYGSQRLEASDESQSIQGRHAAIYLELAERLAPQADGPEHAEWLHQLEAEYDNLRAALGWLAAHNATGGLRLAIAVETVPNRPNG